jgi:hypothetical protein
LQLRPRIAILWVIAQIIAKLGQISFREPGSRGNRLRSIGKSPPTPFESAAEALNVEGEVVTIFLRGAAVLKRFLR